MRARKLEDRMLDLSDLEHYVLADDKGSVIVSYCIDMIVYALERRGGGYRFATCKFKTVALKLSATLKRTVTKAVPGDKIARS